MKHPEIDLDDQECSLFWAAMRIWDDTPKLLKPLIQPARYKGAHGGRGGGKSHFFAALAVLNCIRNPGTRIVCIREIQKSLKDSVKLLIEDKIRSFCLEEEFAIKNDSIQTPGNGLIIFQGMQEHNAQSIKSLEGFSIAYVEEAQTITSRSLELLRPTIRKTGSELWFSWNPRHDTDPVDELLRKDQPKDALVVEVNWRDNPHFPRELNEERKHDYEKNPQRYRHIWEGHYEPQAVGALWTGEMINRHRVASAPPLERIVVAIDPACSSEPGSDENGIIMVGLGADGRAYVIADRSLVGRPDEWAHTAIDLFDLNQADNIVIETNQGGEMAINTLRAIRPGLPIIDVRASRGKHVRAEPIAALYATDKVSHVGSFPELEHQMCQMTAGSGRDGLRGGYQGDGSPDRCDALVWGLTALFSQLTRERQKQEWRLAPTHGRMPIQKHFVRETRWGRR